MGKSNSLKPIKVAHTANQKIVSGDYYGTGVKAKTGRMIDDSMGMKPVLSRKMKTPPKSLA